MICLQETQFWPTAAEWLAKPGLPWWELRHDPNSKVGIMWLSSLAHLQRGPWSSLQTEHEDKCHNLADKFQSLNLSVSRRGELFEG